MNMDNLALLDALVGKTEGVARSLGLQSGFAVRVTYRDGKTQVITMDVRMDRIGLHVWNGIVTEVKVG